MKTKTRYANFSIDLKKWACSLMQIKTRNVFLVLLLIAFLAALLSCSTLPVTIDSQHLQMKGDVRVEQR